MTESSAEQRRTERVRVGLELAIAQPTPEGRHARKARLTDISLGGACVETDLSFRPGQQVDLAIPTNGATDVMGIPAVVRGKGIVQRVANCGPTRRVAMKFTPSLAESSDFACFMGYLLSC